MQVQDIMTENPACCTAQTGLRDVAKLMVDRDCGEIPVVRDGDRRPIGVVTDRDIACRAVAAGKDAEALKACDIMSSPVLTVPLEADVEECCHVMEQAQIRRVLVLDHQGRCCGIVSQADIARQAKEWAGEVVCDVSRPARTASRANQIM